MEIMSFAVACSKFFGKLPNQSSLDFIKEIKALTPGDKADLIEMFKTVGIDATKTS